MRIALIHSFYSSRQPSGENAAVESEARALRRAGYDVEVVAAYTDRLEGDLLYPVRAAFRVATGRGATPLKALRNLKPDVVHIHNLFPNFGRRWVEDIEVPVLHTVHNFRPLCANGLLLRDSKVCTDCPDGKRWSGVRHKCYRNSRLATLPIAWANRGGALADPLMRRADRLLMLTERQRDIYVRSGVPRHKTIVAPNFLTHELDPGPPRDTRRSGCLFVGRLSAEKGIDKLVEHWPEGEPLKIIGDGPLRAQIEALASRRPEITIAGSLPRNAVIAAMQLHRRLVFPSLWFEGFPMVYPEALACGLPIVAFEPSALAELVTREGTGIRTAWNEAWAVQVANAAVDTPSPTVCREIFEARYSEAAFRERTEALIASLDEPEPTMGTTSSAR